MKEITIGYETAESSYLSRDSIKIGEKACEKVEFQESCKSWIGMWTGRVGSRCMEGKPPFYIHNYVIDMSLVYNKYKGGRSENTNADISETIKKLEEDLHILLNYPTPASRIKGLSLFLEVVRENIKQLNAPAPSRLDH